VAWTAVITHATGDVFPASDWNTYIRDNLTYLRGDSGAAVTINNNLNLNAPSGLAVYAGSAPTSSGFTGAQPGDGSYVDQLGQFASFCNAAVVAFAAGAFSDSVPRWQVDSNGNVSWGIGGSSAPDLRILRGGAGILAIDQSGAGKGNIRGGSQASAPGLPATFTPDLGYMFNRVAPINVSGTLTIAAPTNPPSTAQSGFLFIAIKSPVGALTVAWNAAYVDVSGGPGSGAGTVCMFVWDPGTSKWICIAQVSE
jgi:hypothetical protein